MKYMVSFQPRWNKSTIVVVSFLIFMAVILIFKDSLPKMFILNTSASMPVGLYLIDDSSVKEYEKGDVVILDPPEQVRKFMEQRGYIPANTFLIKRIDGLKGDVYTVKNDTAYINDKYIGIVFKEDSQGRELPCLSDVIIPDKYFLAVADNRPNSFDSRYFGLLPISCIKYKVIPLLTFKDLG